MPLNSHATVLVIEMSNLQIYKSTKWNNKIAERPYHRQKLFCYFVNLVHSIFGVYFYNINII